MWLLVIVLSPLFLAAVSVMTFTLVIVILLLLGEIGKITEKKRE